jgi:hypothetical protein
VRSRCPCSDPRSRDHSDVCVAHEPGRALMDLNREPLLRDVAITGGRAATAGPAEHRGVRIRGRGWLDQNPTPRVLKAWIARRAGQARRSSSMLGGPGLLCGPENTAPVATIPKPRSGLRASSTSPVPATRQRLA